MPSTAHSINLTNALIIALICFGMLGMAQRIQAQDIYIAQTAQGTDTGADGANAHAVTWFNTSGNWANPKVLNKIGPGDTVHLCGTITVQLTVQGSGSSGSPVSVFFENGAKFSAPTWPAGSGAINVSNKNYITIDGGTNGMVEATDNGTPSVFGGIKAFQNNIYGLYLYGVNFVTVKNLTIRNIYDRLAGSSDPYESVGYCIYLSGTSNNVTLDKNALSYAFEGIMGVLNNSTNITASNNTITDTSVGINIAPGDINVTGSNVTVYGNTILGGAVWDGAWNIQGLSSALNAGGSLPAAATFYYDVAENYCNPNSARTGTSTSQTTDSSNRTITVSWNQLSNATLYRVWRSAFANMSSASYIDISGATQLVDDGSLSWTSGTPYYPDTHNHQDGMHFYSQGAAGWMDTLNIYNNFLKDFGTHSTAHIYVEGQWITRVKIYNNICVNTGLNFAANGMITVKAADAVLIYNNTIVGAGPAVTNRGILWNDTSHQSQNGEIKNNIISGVSYFIYWASGTSFTADHNDLHNGQTTPFYDSTLLRNYAWYVRRSKAATRYDS